MPRPNLLAHVRRLAASVHPSGWRLSALLMVGWSVASTGGNWPFA
jgi:hypothetical protein